MENKNKNKNSNSSSENNSSPFPKLKPKGSIYVNEINNNSNNDSRSFQKKSNKSKEKEEENDFLSKLKLFDPNAKINNNRHSNPFKPSVYENVKKDNNYNEKEIDEPLNINKEKEKLSRKKLSYEMPNNNEDKKGKGYTKRLSAKNTFDSAKKLFNSLSDYVNENIINKINFNFNKNDEKEKSFSDTINLDENFEKPENFEEIEKIWHYKKLLLEYNILDITSKLYIINHKFLFFSHL